NTGVLDDPNLTIYLRHWFPPDPNLETVPGEWRVEKNWPPKDRHDWKLYLQPDHMLSESAAKAAVHQLRYVPSIGVEAGFWGVNCSPISVRLTPSVWFPTRPRSRKKWRSSADRMLSCKPPLMRRSRSGLHASLT